MIYYKKMILKQDYNGIQKGDDEPLFSMPRDTLNDKQTFNLEGEKALSNPNLYEAEIKNLPLFIESQNLEELKSIVAKALDKQGKGLDTFHSNLTLLRHLSRNSHNTDIITVLDSIRDDARRVKIINMLVDNAGNFHNLVHDPLLFKLKLLDRLSEVIGYTAKSNCTDAQDYARLNKSLKNFLKLSNEGKQYALELKHNVIDDYINQALGYALARCARQKNPSHALYETLTAVPRMLEELTKPTQQGKPPSEIYDLAHYFIGTQEPSLEAQKLIDNLRALEKYVKNPTQETS